MPRSRNSLARRLVAIAAFMVLSATAAHAAAPPSPGDGCGSVSETNHLVADATQPGVITLYFYDAKGARVRFFECVGNRLQRLGSRRNPPGSPASATTPTRLDATTWSCVRRSRRFAAAATLPGGALAVGSYSVRTPSCAQRFDVRVPRRVAPGAKARIRIVDQWGIGGIRPTLCVTPPAARRTCRRVAFERAVTAATRRLHATTSGRWRVELRVRRHRVRTSFAVGERSAVSADARPTLLASGDSTMQGVDSFLGDELGDEFTVRSDAHPGSQISRTNFWPEHAASQTRRQRQRITVMSVGAASDGFAMTTPAGVRLECCEQPWVLEYARRVRAIMRTFSRKGRGRVFWLTLPAPRYPPRARISSAVNTAIVLAAQGVEGVSVIRIDRIFSPNGFRETIRYRGREVPVREPDGVHLNISGTAIAAKIIARAIRDSARQ